MRDLQDRSVARSARASPPRQPFSRKKSYEQYTAFDAIPLAEDATAALRVSLPRKPPAFPGVEEEATDLHSE